MDDSRFDQLARVLGGSKSRRGLLAAVTALTTGLVAQDQADAQRGEADRDNLEAQGPCSGGAKGNACSRHADCCTDFCDRAEGRGRGRGRRGRGRVRGRCRCKRVGQACSSNKQCCPGKTGRTCRQGTCAKAPACKKAGQPCTTNKQCCPGKTGRTCRQGQCRPASCGDVCATGCTFPTIQAAIDAAAAGATIRLCAETYTENITIDKDLTLVGAGQAATILQGSGTTSVVAISGAFVVTIRDLTITGGTSATNGGGVFNDGGDLTLTNCTISGNSTTGADTDGAGLYNNGGTVNATGCSFSGNTADRDGGGVYNLGGTVIATGCAFTGNTSTTNSGAGLYNQSSGTMTLTTCQISGGQAGDGGGGIYNNSASALTVDGSTITGNHCDNATLGGGIHVTGGATLSCTGDTEISGNTAGALPSECVGSGCETCVP